MRIKQLTQLARQLGINKGYLSRLKRQTWFPQRNDDGWDLDEVRAAIASNVNRRKGADEDKVPDTSRFESDDPLIQALRSSESKPIDIARAAVRLAARKFAYNLETGRIGMRDLDDLKRALEELRRSEEAYVELAERRGELIERDVAKAVAGGLALRLVGILNEVENALAVQVEIWLEDAQFRKLTTDARSRQVREWFDKRSRLIRSADANEVEAMIVGEVQERNGA